MDTSVKLTLKISGFDDYVERLKSYRKHNGIKQAELAVILGVNPYILNSWEKKQERHPYNAWVFPKKTHSGMML